MRSSSSALTAGQSTPGTSISSLVLQACSAIKPTWRRDASSNAISVASSEADEPSTPTEREIRGMWCLQLSVADDRHGAMGVPHQSRTDRAEQTACQSSAAIGADDDEVRTFRPFDKRGAGAENCNSPLMVIGEGSPVMSWTIFDAFAKIPRPSAFCHPATSSSSLACDHVRVAGSCTCSTLIGTPRMTASCAAQLTAASDAGDASSGRRCRNALRTFRFPFVRQNAMSHGTARREALVPTFVGHLDLLVLYRPSNRRLARPNHLRGH